MKYSFLTFQVKTRFKKKKTGENISPVELMAYRSDSKLKSELENKTFNYTKKAIEDEIEGGILLPENAIIRYKEPFFKIGLKQINEQVDDSEARIVREYIWNDVQKAEIGKQYNSRFCREIIIGLPNSLSKEQCHKVIQEYLKKHFVSKGMIADYNIHWKEGNHHVHILLTTRVIDSKGNWGLKEKKDWAYEYKDGEKVQQIDPSTNKPFVKEVKVAELDENGDPKRDKDGKIIYKLDKDGNFIYKTEPEYRIPIIDKETKLQKVDSRNRKQWKREVVEDMTWNTREQLKEWRYGWEKDINKALEEANIDERVSLQSYKTLGLDKLGFLPTKHEGNYATQKRRVAVYIDRSNNNNDIKKYNRDILMGYSTLLLDIPIEILLAIFNLLKMIFETCFVIQPYENVETFEKERDAYLAKLNKIENRIFDYMFEKGEEKNVVEKEEEIISKETFEKTVLKDLSFESISKAISGDAQRIREKYITDDKELKRDATAVDIEDELVDEENEKIEVENIKDMVKNIGKEKSIENKPRNNKNNGRGGM